MRIAIVDTYYQRFIDSFYQKNRGLSHSNSDTQRRYLLDACFGTSDYYSYNLSVQGCEALDLIVNCVPLQREWARENQVPFSSMALRVPHRMFRLPLIGSWLSSLPGLIDVAIAQVRAFRPDILYCQDLSFFPREVLNALKSEVRLIVGQIACPLPPESFLKGYDLILTSFPHFVGRLRSMGMRSEYFRIGFDERVLRAVGKLERDINFSFVGGISRHHANALPLFEYLATNSDINFYGYGGRELARTSPVKKKHAGEVWGRDMYRTLARSRVTLNRHINVAEGNANNMRLYEATGMGALLLTDLKDNLHELFALGREVLAYSCKEEAAELARYYLEHPDQAAEIAKAGQLRTLSEHTYAQRMRELVPILKRHLR